MNSRIWLSSPHLSGNEIKYIEDAFEKNWVTSIGDNLNDFENKLEEYLGEDSYVILLNTCTSAIHLALIECGIGYGDEVICQSMTFSASANPITYCGATPIFVDSESDTWNICPIALEEAIVDRISKGVKPKAIIAVHLYGMPYKIDEIHRVAHKHNIPIIEDAAEALGSTYKGKATGTFGRFGTISFNGNKIITTSGGGALICQSKKEKERVIFLATQARDDAPHYQHSQIGYNYRMSNILAGIGRGQMEVLEDRIIARRAMNSFYQNLFADINGVEVFKEPSTDFYSNHWLSAILIDSKVTGKTREDLLLAFLEDNIESRPLWKPMHLQPIFKNLPYYGSNVSEKLFENGLCLPSGSNLTDQDRFRISKVVVDFFK
ncbi:dTDP-4-amino-4,6-dideoxygalactose transaminase [Chishuiella changwenlii]|uniref:Pyridoxal phosphate-dependent aminotransferase n=1 Tax=Chishuiella changwenlii TaxID=1434701 RepID=A0A1M7A527_9FLAO|nr:aminotransferase class I/II-fold pyridoxal phosphate-dependent enzyme [Chishuiella changwenlii]GGE91630.1 pyridoxal phosphate-dependent aminotransferase [Chishuiella changwenlii]SHL37729.1 dTDP-4-amino-4,6-dideoxygalactose transaminase [Chishuiella changwenlii]